MGHAVTLFCEGVREVKADAAVVCAKGSALCELVIPSCLRSGANPGSKQRERPRGLQRLQGGGKGPALPRVRKSEVEKSPGAGSLGSRSTPCLTSP